MTAFTSLRKPSTALGWFPQAAATESAVIDMANSRQIALRARLRNHYWLTECRPIGPSTVAVIRKKMTTIDLRDAMSDEELSEVLSDHYGFKATAEGSLTVPDLDEARAVAVGSVEAIQRRASAGGRAKAAKAAAKESIYPETGEVSTAASADF